MNRSDLFSLDDAFSTTRHVTKNSPSEVENPELKTVLFLPMDKSRQGEGGLRAKGYFKTSLSDKPLVTIITVVFNGENQLEETILSVINQSYDNIEFIVIDGGSTDSSLDIIKKYDGQIDYWVSEQDEGIYDAWNKGVTCSQGDWISFLGADDVYLPQAVNQYIGLIKCSGDVEYVSSRIDLISNNKVIRNIGDKWSWLDFKKRMNVAHVGSLHAKKLYLEEGLYDLGFQIAGDYEFLLRFGSHLKSAYLNKITVRMSIEGVSNSSLKVFTETAAAKLRHTGRHRIIIYFETMFSILKWYIRKLIWY